MWLTLVGVTEAEFTALNGSEFIKGGGGGNNGPTIYGAGNTVDYTGTPGLPRRQPHDFGAEQHAHQPHRHHFIWRA